MDMTQGTGAGAPIDIKQLPHFCAQPVMQPVLYFCEHLFPLLLIMEQPRPLEIMIHPSLVQLSSACHVTGHTDEIIAIASDEIHLHWVQSLCSAESLLREAHVDVSPLHI